MINVIQIPTQLDISDLLKALSDESDDALGWRDITELRKTDRDYSGFQYSFEYITNNKHEENIYCGTGSVDAKWSKAAVAEQIELKRSNDGSIKYRVIGRDPEKSSVRKFSTQYGVFHSTDNGEFGGSIKLPNGEEISGNFKYVFDVGGKVYAISSLAHMMSASTCIYQINKGLEHTITYKTVDAMTALMYAVANEYKPVENIHCEAVDIKENEAYVILTGYVEKTDELGKRSYWDEERILHITEDGVKEISRFTGKCPILVKSLIVEESYIYVSCDKMVLHIDRSSNEITYLTCITKEDEEELLKNAND